MNEITEETNLLEYPLLIILCAQKGCVLNIKNCNEVWNSLTEEEKATNKDYKVEYRGGLLIAVNKNNGEILKIYRPI